MSIPTHLVEKVLGQLENDPGLPRENPTESFWQLPPDENLSNVQSSALPSCTDYAVIGSGITGCSVTKHLLEHDERQSEARVTVLEARTLCSGATGRNGGALTSFAPFHFTELVHDFGLPEAIKVGRFAYVTLEKMHKLGSTDLEHQKASEVRRLRGVVGYVDEDSFERAKLSIESYEKYLPECTVQPETISAAEAAKRFNLSDISGAIVYNNGAFWPYRLIVLVWERLLAKYGSLLSIETGTSVTEITNASQNAEYPYLLHTPRGTIRAKCVVHATNGYSGHLLPSLRGKTFPYRGIMTTQKSTPEFGGQGANHAWSISHTPYYDEQSRTFETGLYYSNQNAESSDIFIGGDRVELDALVDADDTVVCQSAAANITSVLPRHFRNCWANATNHSEMKSVWSGIMGFSADGMPLVGRLPKSLTCRPSANEWIAAVFNGYGMPQCWSAGEALAKMILYEDVTEWLPAAYLPTSERLAKMSLEGSFTNLLGI